jgi:hypothetical protein
MGVYFILSVSDRSPAVQPESGNFFDCGILAHKL